MRTLTSKRQSDFLDVNVIMELDSDSDLVLILNAVRQSGYYLLSYPLERVHRMVYVVAYWLPNWTFPNFLMKRQTDRETSRQEGGKTEYILSHCGILQLALTLCFGEKKRI